MDENSLKWAEIDRKNEEYLAGLLEADRKKGGVDAEFAEACAFARAEAGRSDLIPQRTEDGELKYRVSQGLKAACHGREDMVATLMLQRSILRRLSRIERLAWLGVATLGYVAYRLA